MLKHLQKNIELLASQKLYQNTFLNSITIEIIHPRKLTRVKKKKKEKMVILNNMAKTTKC